MDYPKCLPSRLSTTLFAASILFGIANGFGGVMRVHRRFAGSRHHFEELKRHDAHRHARLLHGAHRHDAHRHARLLHGADTAIDVPMGAAGSLYYTHLAIGTPPRNYTVYIDSGSDVMWIYCQDCKGCPLDNNEKGIHLTPYDPKTSKTAEIVAAGKDFCKDELPADKKDGPCPFFTGYADGSEALGYYVRDFLTYDKVSGDRESKPAQAKVTFACASRRMASNKERADISVRNGIEGLIGFGFQNISVVSQLASSGIVRNEFAHCLEPSRGGGVFSIGHVVKPEVKMISLHPDDFYSLLMRSADVGGKAAGSNALGSEKEDKVATFDSGASLLAIPETLHSFVTKEILSHISDLNVFVHDNFTCFNHSGSVDLTGFPPINFHLFGADSTEATLTVSPRDYVLPVDDHQWCLGLLRSGDIGLRGALFGDVALANKLVIYDAENRKIGWKDHDCSSTIEVEGGESGVRDVGAHFESSPTSSN